MNQQTKRRRVRQLIRRDGEECCYCGVSLTPGTRTIDHVIPRSLGGSNKIDNLVLACSPCNEEKGGVHSANSTSPGTICRPRTEIRHA